MSNNNNIIEGCKQVIIKLLDDKKNKTSVSIDECISREIEKLWNKGITTTDCCCGHGKRCGYIQVIDADITKMEQMEYIHYLFNDNLNQNNAFIPKTHCKHHRSSIRNDRNKFIIR